MPNEKRVVKGLCHCCLSSNVMTALDAETGKPVCGKCSEKRGGLLRGGSCTCGG